MAPSKSTENTGGVAPAPLTRVHASSATPASAPSLAVVAGSAAVLAGYLGGRTLFERLSAWLAAHGVSAGLAVIVPLPIYVGLVIAGISVAVRAAGPAADPGAHLALSARVRRQAAAGFLLGVSLAAVVYAVAILAGWATLRFAAPSAHLVASLAGYAILYGAIAYSEELVFRGALLGLLGRWSGPWLAVVLSSALFAAVHVAASITWTRLLGVFLFGLLLALLRLRTGSLWPAIASHWSFHFLSFALVLGLPPVGVSLTGSIWVVGTPDQVDAGLLGIAAIAVAVAAALAEAKYAHRLASAP
jgi:membrane protease YdiL (CAAX protease family)